MALFLCVAVGSAIAAGPINSNVRSAFARPKHFGLQKGEAFPEIELTDLTGKKVKLSELAKDKLLIVRLECNWTPPVPMMSNLPNRHRNMLSAAQKEYLGKIAVVDILVKSKRTIDEITEDCNKSAVASTVLLDEEGVVLEKLKAKEIPLIIFASENKVVAGFIHLNDNDLKAIIERYLTRGNDPIQVPLPAPAWAPEEKKE